MGGTLDKRKILDFMTNRFKSLEEHVTRDFGGGLANRVGEYREVKYWKEAIERGEFDTNRKDDIDGNNSRRVLEEVIGK